MAAATPVPAAERSLRLWRLVDVESQEIAALLASFAMFFALPSAYYIIRPVRDEIGATLGEEALLRLFTVVFFVMVILGPLFAGHARRELQGPEFYRHGGLSRRRCRVRLALPELVRGDGICVLRNPAVAPTLVVWIWIAARLGISYRRAAESH